MTITEKFQNKRCVFSIECFPPKQTTQMDKMKATLQAMRALNPDFISVTFGAGGSAGGVSTVEVADYIQHEVGVPALAHLTRPVPPASWTSWSRPVCAMCWPCAATAPRPDPKARTSSTPAT